MLTKMVGYFVGLVAAGLTVTALADVRLPGIFSDHMVLQRDQAVPVWGWAQPGEEITVKMGVAKATTTTGKDGRWMVKLAPQPMSAAPLTLTVAGRNTVTVQDVLLGDVWLCSGQSNMEFGLGGCNAPQDIEAAQFPTLRRIKGSSWVSAQVGYDVQEGMFKGLGFRVEGNNLNDPTYVQLRSDGTVGSENKTGHTLILKVSYKLQ